MSERSPVGYEFSVNVQEIKEDGTFKTPTLKCSNLTILDRPELMGELLLDWQDNYSTMGNCPTCDTCLTNFLYLKETRDFIKVENPEIFKDLVHIRLNNLFS